jgi:two-component system sensor histidine kinase CiaH
MADTKVVKEPHYQWRRFKKWLQRIRASLPQEVKMTILMVVGFTFVFVLIGTFTVNQFRTVMYGNAQHRVSRVFDVQTNRFDRPIIQTETAQITDFVDSFKVLNLPKENKVYLRQYRGSWYFF